jgi:DNA-binding MarR family transcriptional regulator
MARERLLTELGGTFRAYQRAVDVLDDLAAERMGVNRTDARVIDLLDERGRMTAGEIAEAAGLTSGAVTGVLDRLERAGYARRVRDEEDRRRVLVEPTAVAGELAREIYSGLADKGRETLEEYSDDQIEMFIDVMRKVTGITDDLAEELREAARALRRTP